MPVNSLFAPWRMEFIEKNGHYDSCVLCDIGKSDHREKDYVLWMGRLNYVVLNRFPYTHGHLMVVPLVHECDWTKLQPDTLAEMAELSQRAIRVFRSELKCEAFNMGVNLGRAAGAGIEAHVHQHIVPRWVGDFNFMPLLAETKVISEHLDATFARLKKGWL